MEPCNRCEEGIYTKKMKSLSIIKRRKGRGKRIHQGAVEKRIHSAIKITTNGTSVLCREEG